MKGNRKKVQFLYPPPNVDGGNVFTPVSLSVCEQVISKSYGRIWMKFGGQVECATMPNCSNFGEYPDLGMRIKNNFFNCFFTIEKWDKKKTTKYSIFPRVVDGL